MSENQAIAKNDVMETDDDRLAYTQGKRRELIEEMTKAGVPSDKGDKMVLLAALDGMDRVSIANKKIGATEKQGAADRQAAILIAKLGRTPFGTPSGSPFERPVIEGESKRIEPVLDTTGLDELELVPGETGVGIATRNFEQFMADGANDQDTDQP